MIRSFRLISFAFAALCVAPTAAAGSVQDFERNIARAIKILDELDRLLSGILDRQAAPVKADAWVDLFDGKSLGGWKVTEFAGAGDVNLEKAFRGGPPAIVVNTGVMLSGFNWIRDVPRTNYEISLEAMKIDGNDFM